MKSGYWRVLRHGWLAAALAVGASPAQAASEQAYMMTGEQARPPIGWVQFCTDRPHECEVAPTMPRDVVPSTKPWKGLVPINNRVNKNIKPMTDLDHYGVVEKGTSPDDG